MPESRTALTAAVRRIGCLLGLILLPTATPLMPQTDTASVSMPVADAGGFYDYSRFGGIPMEVNIWGFVRSPGRYKVPSSTTLVELISLAGGPIEHAQTGQVRIVRDLSVDSSVTQAVVVYDIDRFIAAGDAALNPVLYPNSTVYVPGDSTPSTIQNTLSIIASVATVTLSIIGIFVAIK